MDMKGKRIFLAPLAGITDTIFRRICKEYGAQVVMSGMVSSEGILRNDRRTTALLPFDESERPIGIQLFGADPSRVAASAAQITEQVRPDFIDLNAGCPVPKVVSGGAGAALLRDRPRYTRMVAAVARATPLPVTVKLRLGWSPQELVDVDYASIAQDAGASAVILHARTRSMFFSGQAMWDRIAKVKRSLAIPLIGNGDVRCGADAIRMLAQTGCDAVMIGRAALGNPWIFSEIAAALEGRNAVMPSPQERRSTIIWHIRTHAAVYGSRRAASEMKKHLCWYLRGLQNAAMARQRACAASTVEELVRIVEECVH